MKQKNQEMPKKHNLASGKGKSKEEVKNKIRSYFNKLISNNQLERNKALFNLEHFLDLMDASGFGEVVDSFLKEEGKKYLENFITRINPWTYYDSTPETSVPIVIERELDNLIEFSRALSKHRAIFDSLDENDIRAIFSLASNPDSAISGPAIDSIPTILEAMGPNVIKKVKHENLDTYLSYMGAKPELSTYFSKSVPKLFKLFLQHDKKTLKDVFNSRVMGNYIGMMSGIPPSLVCDGLARILGELQSDKEFLKRVFTPKQAREFLDSLVEEEDSGLMLWYPYIHDLARDTMEKALNKDTVLKLLDKKLARKAFLSEKRGDHALSEGLMATLPILLSAMKRKGKLGEIIEEHLRKLGVNNDVITKSIKLIENSKDPHNIADFLLSANLSPKSSIERALEAAIKEKASLKDAHYALEAEPLLREISPRLAENVFSSGFSVRKIKKAVADVLKEHFSVEAPHRDFDRIASDIDAVKHILAISESVPEIREALQKIGKEGISSLSKPHGVDSVELKGIKAEILTNPRELVKLRTRGHSIVSGGGWLNRRVSPHYDEALVGAMLSPNNHIVAFRKGKDILAMAHMYKVKKDGRDAYLLGMIRPLLPEANFMDTELREVASHFLSKLADKGHLALISSPSGSEHTITAGVGRFVMPPDYYSVIPVKRHAGEIIVLADVIKGRNKRKELRHKVK